MKLKNLLYGIFAATIAATAVSAISVVASADAGDSYGPYTLTIDHDFPSDKVHIFALNLMKFESTDTQKDSNWNYEFKNVELKLDGKAVDTSSCAGYIVTNHVKFAENWSGEESIEGLGNAKSIQVTFDLVDTYGSGVPDAYICTSITDGNWGGSPSVKLLTPTTEEETSIALDQTTLSLKAGETATLKATTTPADAEVTWKSSNEKIATVKDGVVTAVAAGEATITATAGEKTAECAVTVSAAVVDPGDDEDTSDYASLLNEDFATENFGSKQISLKAVAGDKITVAYTIDKTADYCQLSFKQSGDGWPALTSPTGTNEWGCIDVDADGTYTFTLNEQDAADITANSLVLTGRYVTYTKVELNADKKPQDDPDDDNKPDYDTLKVTKVSDFKTDGTSELYVRSFTLEDVKSFSDVTIIVKLSNGKRLVKDTTKCFKGFKYINTTGDTVTVTSAENYFVVVKVINIPAGVTVEDVIITHAVG